MYLVENPTSKKKLVKWQDGETVLLPNSSVTIDANWDEDRLQKYRDAGLVVTGQDETGAAEAAKKAVEKPAK